MGIWVGWESLARVRVSPYKDHKSAKAAALGSSFRGPLQRAIELKRNHTGIFSEVRNSCLPLFGGLR